MNKAECKIEEFPDGALCLSCNGTDLVFAEGAMRGDPALAAQREVLEYIVDALDSCSYYGIE